MDDQNEAVIRKEEDIRASVISDYGFDADTDTERIEKLVTKELDHDKKLSSAIGAKIKHRKEAEDLRGKIPPEVTPPEDKGLSQDDVIYVAKAPIHEEDIKEVLGYAKTMKISAKEAHNFYKPILEKRDEERKTAETTAIKGGARAIIKDTPDSLISRAQKGEEVDPDKLAAARMQKAIENSKQ